MLTNTIRGMAGMAGMSGMAGMAGMAGGRTTEKRGLC